MTSVIQPRSYHTQPRGRWSKAYEAGCKRMLVSAAVGRVHGVSCAFLRHGRDAPEGFFQNKVFRVTASQHSPLSSATRIPPSMPYDSQCRQSPG